MSRESLVIISPDPVICTIQISAKVVQLSLMCLSLHNIIYQASVYAGATSIAAIGRPLRISRISSMRPMLLLQEDSFIFWLRGLMECGLLLPDTLKDIARRTPARNGLSPKKLLEIWFSNFLFTYRNIMQRLSSATGL